jgi:hypothetical protein
MQDLEKNAGTKFRDVQIILDDAIVNAPDIGFHGTFWRGVTRDEFVVMAVFGCSIIHTDANGKFIGSESPLVKILRGDIDCGGDFFPQMPFGFEPVSEEKIQIISDWIDTQCPD